MHGQTIIGNLNALPVIRNTYFFKLDLSSVYPQAFSSSNLIFVNSIARSLGLHDFYQVGLWSYCEGYSDEYDFWLLPAKTRSMTDIS
jgi:hypothetical protein